MERKTLREKFEDNYMAVPVPADNAQGFKMKYVYYAPWYLWDLPEKELKREKTRLALYSAAGLLAFLLSAAQACALNRSPVLFLPCALALCCHVMEFSALLQFAAAKRKTTKMTFEEVDRALRFAPLLRGICCGLSAAVCLGALLPGPFSARTAWMAAGLFTAAATAWAVQNRYSRLPVSVEENHSLEEIENMDETR